MRHPAPCRYNDAMVGAANADPATDRCTCPPKKQKTFTAVIQCEVSITANDADEARTKIYGYDGITAMARMGRGHRLVSLEEE